MHCKPYIYKLKMMKKAWLYLLFLFTFLNTSIGIFAQTTGYEISNKVYETFNTKKVQIRTQDLVISGENQFPYNVIINFQSYGLPKSFNSKQLLLVIDQEQALKHKYLINYLIEYFQEHPKTYNATILLACGDNPELTKANMISGTNVYLQNSDDDENTTAIYINLDDSKNQIVTSSNGISSPSFLVKAAFNIFSKNHLNANLPLYYFSQQHKFKFFLDSQLDNFFTQEIPAIKLSFNKNCEELTIFEVCSEMISEVELNTNNMWDQHFIIYKVGNTYFRINETDIVRLIISLFFICILFNFILFFVNHNIKNLNWKKIIKIWYSVPLTYLLIYAGFFAGKLFYVIFASRLTYTGKISFLFSAQLICSLLFTSVYFVLQIKKGHRSIEPKSIDFLIVFTSSINLILFSLVDISLFPIMLITLLLSIGLLIFTKRFFHIAILVIMILQYIPYIHNINSIADPVLFQSYFTTKVSYYAWETLVMSPLVLTYLRILASFKNKLKNYKELIIVTGITTGFLVVTVIITAITITNSYNKERLNVKTADIKTVEYAPLDFKYYDSQIFTDKIRKINVKVPENTIHCIVNVETTSNSPILYSDNDVISISPNKSTFAIPYKPSGDLQFTYGYLTDESTIEVEIYTKLPGENNYSLLKNSITTGTANE